MSRPKLLFINPPGTQTYIRGYFCSQTSKADYVIQPIDFICLSGFLKTEFELHFIDAIRDRQSPSQVLGLVKNLKPDVVICLAGMASAREDIPFLEQLKDLGVPRLLGLGDLFLGSFPEAQRICPSLDGVLHSFIDPIFPAGRTQPVNPSPSRSPIHPVENSSPGDSPEPAPNPLFSLPVPQHELFLHPGYSFPFARHPIHATVLTDFACPFSCSFCVMSSFPYRFRPVENVLEELQSLHALGVRELFFIDQSFGVTKSRTEAILQAMIKNDWAFSWTCYSRVDLVDLPFLRLMKQAGCHTIIFGVESGSEKILQQYGKGYSLSQIRRAFHLCRKVGMRTVGTFLLGFPEDTRETCQATIQLAISLRCDFASFNFAFPRKKTVLSDANISDGLSIQGDQSGRHLAGGTQHLTIQELEEFRDRAIRSFYFRPGYLLRHLIRIRSWHEVQANALNALGLLKRLFPEKTER